MKLVVEKLGHPREHYDSDKVRAEKRAEQNQHRRRAPESSIGILACTRGGHAIRRPSVWLDQESPQDNAQQNSQPAENHEAPAPSVLLTHKPGEIRSEEHTSE